MTNLPDNSGGSTPLRFLQTRDTVRAAKARGPRRIMGWLRLALPAFSLLALIGLIAWPLVNPDKILSKALKNVPDLVIKNLNFTDVDSKSQPYSISAIKATRPSGDKNIFDLDHPQGEITLQEGAWIAAQSDMGRYDKDHSLLWMGGNVQFFHDKGIEFSTDELQADLKEHTAWGERPVHIQGDFGQIRGTGFRLIDSGNVFIVKGPVKAILNLRNMDTSTKQPASP